MWEEINNRLLLLELLVTGRTQRRRSQAAAWAWMEELPWTVTAPRRGERTLVEAHRQSISELINRVWPAWQQDALRLSSRLLSPTPDGWRDLRDAERAESLPPVPARINRHTAAAIVGPHSKSELTEQRLEPLADVEITHDGVLRLRTPPGVHIRRGASVLDADAIVAVLGEVALPERALIDGTFIDGPIRGVVLVENLGPFQDMEAVPGAIFAHVPGWDTRAVRTFLERLPEHIAVIHFGDLDPNGVRIARHLKASRVDLLWAVPPFWREVLEERGQAGEWPDDLDLTGEPALVQELGRAKRWLEQESVVLDARLASYLDELLRTSGP